MNELAQNANLNEAVSFFIFAILLLLFYFIVGRRVVAMSVTNSSLEFNFKGETITRKWNDVEYIKKSWLIAPPLYSVRFKDTTQSYYFNTGYRFIAIPFFIFDTSDMGQFIKNKKKHFKFDD
jgi:hypothetical protein